MGGTPGGTARGVGQGRLDAWTVAVQGHREPDSRGRASASVESVARRAMEVGRAGAAGIPLGRRATENPTKTLKRDLNLSTYLRDVLDPSCPRLNEVAGFRKLSAWWSKGAAGSRRSPGGRARCVSLLRLPSWVSGSPGSFDAMDILSFPTWCLLL